MTRHERVMAPKRGELKANKDLLAEHGIFLWEDFSGKREEPDDDEMSADEMADESLARMHRELAAIRAELARRRAV